uniref:Uncharacterized protein n=1 Tax=Tanacetum cinerariifolium TaxID=118510 RepID=A0A6L2NRC0_TANCI|nr:hypothetical protein [Tanacetum cinerariifolium]
MASSATTAPSIPIFSGTHYHIWAVNIKTYLKSQGLWKVVETDESTPALGENPTVAQLRTYDTESLKKDKALTCLYSGTDRVKAVRLLTLKREFELLRMKDDELVKDYSARMMDVVNQMMLHEEVVKDQKVVEKMMISVPPKFEAKTSAIKESCDLDTLMKGTFPPCNICPNTNHQEADCWFKDKPNFKCNFCNKFGHLEKYCRVKKARNNTQGVQQENVSEEHQANDEHLFMALHLDKHPNSLTWLTDRGCKSHMTPKRYLFLSLDTKDNPRVKLGEGRYTRVKRRGTIAINTKKGILDMVNDSYYLKLDVADASAFSVTEDDSMNEVDILEFDIKDTNDTYVLRTRPLVDIYESCNLVIEPESYMNASKHSKWIDAMKAELEMIKKNNIWKLVDLLDGKNAIDMGLVSDFLGMEIKQLPNGVHISQRKPNLAFAASFLSRFMGEPSSSHLGAAKRVLRYVKGSLDLRIMFERNKVVKLEGYADSDWVRSIDDSKSTLGYIFTLGPTAIFCDNKSAIAIAKNTVQHGRRKRINVKYHAIREAEKNEEVKLKYCTSET